MASMSLVARLALVLGLVPGFAFGTCPTAGAAPWGISTARYEMVRLLLELGAGARARTRDAQTPLDLARERHRDAVVEYLSAPPAR